MPSTGAHCAVRGCSNNYGRLQEWLDRECFDHKPETKRNCPCPPMYALHSKPKDECESRMWLKNLNLKKPPKTIFVCSFHFVDKKPTTDNPYPELYLGYERKPTKTRRVLKRVVRQTDHGSEGKQAENALI